MSTDLYRVRVLDVDHEHRRVRFRVLDIYRTFDYGHDVAAADQAQGLHPASFVTHDPDELLPDDPSFFFRVLWEAEDADGRQPMEDVVTVDEITDEDWVDENTHRFVAGVERVAERNHPMGREVCARLAAYFEHHDTLDDEDVIPQGDYDVHVTDPRWLEPLRTGQVWGTTFYATEAVA